jgi:nucleoside 2-deoxyribosyltransferase
MQEPDRDGGASWAELIELEHKGMAYEHCFICKGEVGSFESRTNGTMVDCEVCKPYTISEKALRGLFQSDLTDQHLVSGAIRELNERGLNVIINDFQSLLDSVVVPDGPLERIDRMLLYVFKNMATYHDTVTLDEKIDYAVVYAKSPSEFSFLRDQAKNLGYLESPVPPAEEECRLTLEGWKQVAELKKHEIRTNQAFVAMSFDPILRSIYLEGIKPALTQTGYVPLRVDETEYNDKIDDRIIADIRKSSLVIADFTQHKAGVYFEAGFALGLGIPVIWICRDEDIEKTHFDTRQYNHITWKDAEDLQQKLIARIEATVPLKKGAANRKIG